MSRKVPRYMWVPRGPWFTGWSGHSDVWVCRATRHGLAGKTPPTGSSQWTVCDHHPDCRIPPLHHPSTAEDTHMHIHTDKRTRWLTAHEAQIWKVVFGTWMKNYTAKSNSAVLTGKIWKCLIFCMWHRDSTNVFGLLWLSLRRNTLKTKRKHWTDVVNLHFYIIIIKYR